MIRTLTALLCFFTVGVLSSGCATIFSGTSDRITIESEPPGAKIRIDGLDRGRTPATIKVKRPGLAVNVVTLLLDGYENRTFVLQKRFNAVSVLNLVCPLCWLIDVATGAVFKDDLRMYEIELDPKR